jgi:uncharacterized alpha-E superfamily protein
VTARKATRLLRFKNEPIIFMIFEGENPRLRIFCVEKVKRNLSFVKQIFRSWKTTSLACPAYALSEGWAL